MSVLLGNGDGTFQSHIDYLAGTTFIFAFAHATAMAVADVDADGKSDVVVAIGTSGIETFFGNGDGTLQSGFLCSCGATLGNIINRVAAVGPITTADFNGDSKLDLSLNDAIHQWGGGSHGEGDVLRFWGLDALKSANQSEIHLLDPDVKAEEILGQGAHHR